MKTFKLYETVIHKGCQGVIWEILENNLYRVHFGEAGCFRVPGEELTLAN